MTRRSVLACGVIAACVACGSDMKVPSAPPVNEVAVLVGAGDIGVCGSSRPLATGRLLDTEQGTVMAVGDLAYTEGTAEQFTMCYEPAWGRHKARTRPAPGNHEYGSPGAAPYFEYFGSNAGPAGLGYYTYRLGAWQVFSLNSNHNVSNSQRTAQLDWLGQQLAAPGAPACSAAYFHHSLFTSGSREVIPPIVTDFWRALYAAGVDVIISAHEHFYERAAPQTPDGAPDDRFGIRQFVVGTGGAGLAQPTRSVGNSETVMSTHGVLRLTLDTQSYRWAFLAAEGGAVLDSGTGTCHGKP